MATWKKLGYTIKTINNYQSRGSANIRVDAAHSSVRLKIKESVYHPKAIKLVE